MLADEQVRIAAADQGQVKQGVGVSGQLGRIPGEEHYGYITLFFNV